MYGAFTPNILAYAVLFGWPVVVFILFKRLPLKNALVCSILAGYLLLPTGLGVDLPLIPSLDKASIPSLSCLAACLIISNHQNIHTNALTTKPKVNVVTKVYFFLLGLLFLTPFTTVLTNPEPVISGPTFIPGQSLYDAAGLCGVLFITVLPLLLADKFLASERSHVIVLNALCISGILYSLLVIIEARLSPQLHSWIYGYFPHSFLQHIRSGGYRPIVFLEHGLWVGIFLCKATIASSILWKYYGGTKKSIPYFYATAFLFSVLFISRNFGALLIALAILPPIIVIGVRKCAIIPVFFAAIVLMYPILRDRNIIPTEFLVETAAKIDEERARSLEYRIDMEDSMLERAMEKPLAGWGLWNRGAIHDPQTGQNLTVPDGIWIIVINSFGWMGYLATFGLFALPIFALYVQRKKPELSIATIGITLVLAASLIDSIPNATLSPIVYLAAGSLIGYCRKKGNNDAEREELSTQISLTLPKPLIKRSRRT